MPPFRTKVHSQLTNQSKCSISSHNKTTCQSVTQCWRNITFITFCSQCQLNNAARVSTGIWGVTTKRVWTALPALVTVSTWQQSFYLTVSSRCFCICFHWMWRSLCKFLLKVHLVTNRCSGSILDKNTLELPLDGHSFGRSPPMYDQKIWQYVPFLFNVFVGLWNF